MLKTESLVI